ncbi:MAG: hypothetical protein QOE28_1108 [Solirubrobacteraceae bacterium]|jgi:hypothetical protein|nr:hypothetical protein [Solirubrobacteraceae bacterium]
MRPFLLLMVISATLALAAPAAAKELAGARACGADGCRDVSARASMAGMEGGPPGVAPAARAPFYRLRWTIAEGTHRPSFWTLYVPSLGKERGGDGTWMNPPSTALDVLDRMVRGQRPYPAARLPLPPPERPAPVLTPGPATPAPVSTPGPAPSDSPALPLAGGGLFAAAALALALRLRHRGV